MTVCPQVAPFSPFVSPSLPLQVPLYLEIEVELWSYRKEPQNKQRTAEKKLSESPRNLCEPLRYNTL